MSDKTWTITDADGTVRVVTLAQFKAIVAQRREAAAPIMSAIRRGDIAATAREQAAFRAKFGAR